MAVVHLFAANEPAFSNSALRIKNLPLGAECQSQSTHTFRSLFPAPGVTGLEAARVTKGSPQTMLAQKRRVVSSEL